VPSAVGRGRVDGYTEELGDPFEIGIEFDPPYGAAFRKGWRFQTRVWAFLPAVGRSRWTVESGRTIFPEVIELIVAGVPAPGAQTARSCSASGNDTVESQPSGDRRHSINPVPSELVLAAQSQSLEASVWAMRDLQ
jgi:hypothetical protein